MPAVAPGDPVAADLPVRLVARVIDVAVLAAVTTGLGLMMGFGYDWLFIGSVLVLAYFTLFDTLTGATPGKAALGLRVNGPTGGRPTLGQALVREAFTVIGAVPFIGPLLALVTWLWIVTSVRASPLRQGVHDRLAGGTRVVRM